MPTGLILAPGLDLHLAQFSLRTIKAASVAFLCTEATIGVCHSLAEAAAIPASKVRTCYIKDIFSSSETIQEFINAFEWMRGQDGIDEVWIDATNCITVIEMSAYLTASFIDLYREVLGENIALRLAYIHAQYSKSESGVYAEVPGTEQLVELEKPVDSLGFVLFAEAIRAFNRGRLEDAAENFLSLSKNSSGDRHIFYEALYSLARGYDCWDKMRFDAALELCGTAIAQFARVRGHREAKRLAEVVGSQKEILQNLIVTDEAAVVADLTMNAMRREQEGRCDDALARLYACVERMVQARLTVHGITTKAPDYSRLPESVYQELLKTYQKAPVELELKKAAHLLSLLEDPVGKAIVDIGHRTFTGLIGLRNDSLLAHGTKPISKEHYAKFKAVLFDPISAAYWGDITAREREIEPHRFIQLTSFRTMLYQETIAASQILGSGVPPSVQKRSS